MPVQQRIYYERRKMKKKKERKSLLHNYTMPEYKQRFLFK